MLVVPVGDDVEAQYLWSMLNFLLFVHRVGCHHLITSLLIEYPHYSLNVSQSHAVRLTVPQAYGLSYGEQCLKQLISRLLGFRSLPLQPSIQICPIIQIPILVRHPKEALFGFKREFELHKVNLVPGHLTKIIIHCVFLSIEPLQLTIETVVRKKVFGYPSRDTPIDNPIEFGPLVVLPHYPLHPTNRTLILSESIQQDALSVPRGGVGEHVLSDFVVFGGVEGTGTYLGYYCPDEILLGGCI